jgi:hypothetical protein
MKAAVVFSLALSLVSITQISRAQRGTALGALAGTASMCPNIEGYGGSTTNADNSAALAAALRATSGGGRCVFFPPGTYAFASKFTFVLPSGSAGVTLAGAGADVTQLYWPAGGGLTIDYVGAENSVHIRNMSFTTGTTGVGSAIVLNQTQGDIGVADNALSDLTNVTIRGGRWIQRDRLLGVCRTGQSCLEREFYRACSDGTWRSRVLDAGRRG